LFDIVHKDPLKNIIANVNAHEVTFKTQEPDEPPEGDADENAKIRQQMASKQVG